MTNVARKVESEAPLQERFGRGRVKGSMVRAHVDWVRDFCDRNDVVSFFDSLPAAMRPVLAASWYEFQDVIEVDRTIMNRFGKGELPFLQELGAYSARQNLTGVYRSFQRSGVHEFFRRSAVLHNQFQDFGSAQYVVLGDTRGQMIHAGYSSYSPLYCSSAIGFHRECIRLHNGVDVDVWESRCQCRGEDSCTFELAWS